MNLLQKLERLLFGYTAEEAVEIRRRWVQGVVDQRIAAALDARAEDDSDGGEDDSDGEGGPDDGAA